MESCVEAAAESCAAGAAGASASHAAAATSLFASLWAQVRACPFSLFSFSACSQRNPPHRCLGGEGGGVSGSSGGRYGHDAANTFEISRPRNPMSSWSPSKLTARASILAPNCGIGSVLTTLRNDAYHLRR